MRISSAIFGLAILSLFVATSSLRADEAAEAAAARREARRDLAIAKMELRHYWQVEYPRQRREMNAAIELTQAEVDDLKARLRAYGPFTRYSTGSPFLITLQNLRMCLREAELRLRDLWAERNNFIRFHSEQWKILEMQAFEARVRVAELDAEYEAASKRADAQPPL